MRRVSLAAFAVVLFSVLIGGTPAQAQDKPIQLSLFTPIQIFPDDVGIKGFRFDLIYGRNAGMVGFDLGIANHTTDREFVGVEWGLVGITEADGTGWQNNAVSWAGSSFTGLQTGIFNRAGRLTGLQLGLINYAESVESGLQIGLANIIKEGGWLPFMVIVNGGF